MTKAIIEFLDGSNFETEAVKSWGVSNGVLSIETRVNTLLVSVRNIKFVEIPK